MKFLVLTLAVSSGTSLFSCLFGFLNSHVVSPAVIYYLIFEVIKNKLFSWYFGGKAGGELPVAVFLWVLSF